MSTYICTKCGCVDNTACGGNYWSLQSKKPVYKSKEANEVPLCVECLEGEYTDGSVNRKAGKWHDIFAKKHWSAYSSKEKILKECAKGQGNFVNAVEYFDLEGDLK